MTNMIPQSPDNNQGPWAVLEGDTRNFLSGSANEAYVISGGYGQGGTGSNGAATTVAGGQVTVPAYTWKVILVMPKGEDDVSRVTTETRTIAIIMPNVQGIRSNRWQQYLVTVDDVEALTGFDFFSNVPVEIQAVIESRLDAASNSAPVADSQVVSTAEDTPLPITLTATDANENNTLTYSVTGQPQHGTLSGTGANLVYTPDANYYGTDGFTFKASDGTADSNTATVNITVTEVNDAPTAAGDSKTTDEDTPLVFTAGDLLTNDSAGPNEAGQTLTVTQVISTVNTNGQVSLSGGQVTYQPDANFYGIASFDYKVCDNGTTNGISDVKCSIGTVTVTVVSVNDAPTLAAIGDMTVFLGNTLGFTASATDIDLPSDTLTFSLSGTVPAGAAINPTTGAFSWTPAAAQAGQIYTLTVRVTDAGGLYCGTILYGRGCLHLVESAGTD